MGAVERELPSLWVFSLARQGPKACPASCAVAGKLRRFACRLLLFLQRTLPVPCLSVDLPLALIASLGAAGPPISISLQMFPTPVKNMLMHAVEATHRQQLHCEPYAAAALCYAPRPNDVAAGQRELPPHLSYRSDSSTEPPAPLRSALSPCPRQRAATLAPSSRLHTPQKPAQGQQGAPPPTAPGRNAHPQAHRPRAAPAVSARCWAAQRGGERRGWGPRCQSERKQGASRRQQHSFGRQPAAPRAVPARLPCSAQRAKAQQAVRTGKQQLCTS